MKFTTLFVMTGLMLLEGADWASLTQEGIALHQQGRYADAERRFDEAWSLAQTFSPDDVRRWRSLHNVASLAYVRGDYGRARQLYTKLLATPAPSAVERAKALSVMALFLRTKGQLEEAESKAREAGRILRAEAPQSKELANAYHILAEIQRHRRSFAEAHKLLDDAARIVAGFKTPDALEGMVLQSRASLFRDQGKTGKAEEPQRRAAAIFESLCGPRHPLTVTGISNLGQILFALDKAGEAQPLMERALDTWESELGPSHPNVATASNNLAQLYRVTGRLVDADPLYRKAIVIWEQSLGADHPDVAKGWKNLGDLYKQEGKLRGAETLYLRARRIFESSYGPHHPLTEDVLVSLKRVYEDSGRRVEAQRVGLSLTNR